MKIIKLTLNEKENIYVFVNKIISLYKNKNIENSKTSVECVDAINYMVLENPLQIIELINSSAENES